MKTYSMKVPCPVCSGNALMTYSFHSVPHYGKTLFSNLHCRKCNFNLNDVQSAQARKPAKYEIKIDSKKDLRTKIVRSSSSLLKIKELGIEVKPGPYSEGYITNIEGVLERVQEALSSLAGLEGQKTQKQKVNKMLEKISKAKNAEIKFTVELIDLQGNGAIPGKKAVKKELKK
ncbi:MAG: ZPR1 zinc finger domain-containing protein [Candidatus Diapherotrites archaeon]